MKSSELKHEYIFRMKQPNDERKDA